MSRLRNNIIIITGGANGIGKAVAELLSIDNYIYILDTDDSNVKYFDSINIFFKKCDISSYAEVDKVVYEIYSERQHIDILVNNASKQMISDFSHYNDKDYLYIMKNNYIGTCNCISAVTKYVQSNLFILNVLSIHSNVPRTNKYAYDSSKSALEILTKELALEFAPRNITINAISFGAVETDMNASWNYNKEEKKVALAKVPLKKIFLPDEIAVFIKTILEVFSRYTTGSIFVVDGGRSLMN